MTATLIASTIAALICFGLGILLAHVVNGWEINGIKAVYEEDLAEAERRLETQITRRYNETKRLADGLRWYAEGQHYALSGWEPCSGESKNWLFPPYDEPNDPRGTDSTWMVDDGSIARAILDGHSMNDDPDADSITVPPVNLVQMDKPLAGSGSA